MPFKEFITELRYVSSIKRSSTFGARIDHYFDDVRKEMEEEEGYKIKGPSPIGSGLDLYIAVIPIGGGKAYADFIVVDRKYDVIDLILSTDSFDAKKKIIKIDTLSASKQSKIRAHKFYEILIKKMDMTLVTDQQSEGGKRVWMKLSRISGIDVHGWDPEENKAINIDGKLNKETEDELYQDDRTIALAKKLDRETTNYYDRIQLVAYKK